MCYTKCRSSLYMSFVKKTKDAVMSSQGMPVVLTLTVIAILFVLFRMKGVETDYRINTVNEKIKTASMKNKELRAKKAKLLSVERLKRLAKKHDFSVPDQKQIIVVP